MYKIYTKNGCMPPGCIEKFLLVMKITTFLIIAALMQVSAAGIAQKLTLVKKDVTLKEVFKEINKQTGYNIFGSDDQINKKIDANFKGAGLLEVLNKCLENTSLTYTVEDKTVIIKVKEISLLDKVKAVFAQVTISGKVVDEQGNPLPGATIKIKNSTTATATDDKGTYTLTVPDVQIILVFSSIGFESQEFKASDIPNGSVITLKAIAQNLHEVIVNKGYYTERQELSTGNVGRITSKEISEQPVSDPIQALIGRVAGLNIQQSSGVPGSYAKINIRGRNSISQGNDPLYIVDGVPFSSVSLTNTSVGGGAVGTPFGVSNATGNNVAGLGLSPFNALNPFDIENIEVLKDADATAIYGSRGANGVILITTKKGKSGDTKFNFEVSQGVGHVDNMMNLLNTQQYLAMRHEAFKNDGLAFPSITTSPKDNNYDVNGVWDTTRYTNWQKVLIGNTAQYTNVQGSISGGNANTQFVLGGGYNRQTTVYPGSFADKKGSVHLNLTHASSDQKFHTQFTVNYVNDNNNIPTRDLTSNIILAPDAPTLYNTNGTPNWQIFNGTITFGNPIAITLNQANAVTNNLISNLNLSYQILPGLQLKSDFGYTHDQMNQSILTPSTSAAPPNNTNPNNRGNSYATTDFQTWIIEPQISYQKRFAKGQLNILIGTTFQENIQKSTGMQAFGFASDALITNPQAASSVTLLNNTYTLYHYNALYGRIGYNWDEKYLLNLTARRDGSSRFGPEQQFGTFGAVGAGWIFTKEKFITNSFPWLSFGKLRASYGTTGNDQITDYQFLSTYSSNSSTYQGITGLKPTTLTNPSFGWEEVKKLEGGLDLGFLNDRINLEVSYYRNRTVNQLVGYPLPSLAGFTTVQFNLPATVQNSGLEIGLNTINIKGKNFSWSTLVNFTLPKNELAAFPNINNYVNFKNLYIVGQSLFIQREYHYTGVNPQTGLYTLQTQNSNGVPSSPQDQIFTQPVTQKFYGGLQNNFSYKGFQLDIFIQFVKQLGYNYINNFNSPGQVNQNEPTIVLDRWQLPGDVTNIQRFGTTSATLSPYITLKNANSDGSTTDASFIRLKNIALSYSIPTKWQQWAHMQNAKVFMQGQNLLTITNYLGLDPETQGLALPPLRMITLGISASF